MKTTTLYTLFFCAAASTFIGWRVHSSMNQEARHVVILMDLSLSHAEGCASLEGLAGHSFQAEGVPAGTTLTVLILGDAVTANEPSQLGTYPIARTRRAIEGRSANA